MTSRTTQQRGLRVRMQQGVKRIAAGLDRVRTPPSGVVVLIYHRVGRRSGLEVDLPTDLFDAQMAALAASGRVVTLDEAVTVLTTGVAPPAGDPIVVTFDDGTADVVDEAVPILVRHRIPALLYLATAFVEEGRPFPADGAPASWAGLADAQSTGMLQVGSHTHTHALLDRLDPVALDDELDRSVALIADRLGVAARHFAYPKAVPGSGPADRAVRARFASAAVAGTRPNPYRGTDLHALARSPIQVADGMRWFERKAAGGMAFEDDLRRGLNRLRYRGATT